MHRARQQGAAGGRRAAAAKPGRWPAAALLTLSLVLARSAAAAEAPPPLEAFFGSPEIGEVALSPSGRTLALTVPGRNGRLELVAADLDRRPWVFKPLAWLKDWHVARPQWLHDKRLVFSAIDDQSGDWGGWRGLWAVDADGQEGRILIDGTYFGYRVVLPADRQMLSAE